MLNNVIDLSHHDTVTSFQEAKLNGIVGVIHKATQGRTVVDAKYHARRARALANGLLWGAYHFGVKGHVADQVEHFLDTVNPTDTDLLVLDFEPNHETDTMTLTEAEQFVTLVNEKVGRFPGLYSGQSFLRQKLGNNTATVLKNCFLWIARYSSELPIVPPAWNTFTLWQYTDGNAGPQPHQVNGIGRCDRNKFNGELTGLRRLWGVSSVNELIKEGRLRVTAGAADDAPSTPEEFVAQIMEEVFREAPGIPLPPNFSDVLGMTLGDFFTPVERCQQVVIEVLARTAQRVNQPITGNDLSFIQNTVNSDTKISTAITKVVQIILA